ncbi:hypothetical protein HMPREF1548_04798 [Clostridium sp. KLE 1755]|nr:hypothetical protein HMPREF1548_04798 [Clostridium sp. KLE 1755]
MVVDRRRIRQSAAACIRLWLRRQSGWKMQPGCFYIELQEWKST